MKKLIAILLLASNAFALPSTPPADVKQHDGNGNAITSTVSGGSRGLDINMLGVSAVLASISATAPLAYTLGVLSLPQATTSVDGFLLHTDWNTFNGKYSGLPSQTGNSGKFLTTNGSSESWANVSNYTFSAPLVNTSSVISIPQSSTSVDGYLSAIDWTAFNGKEPAIAAGTSLQFWRGDKTWQTLNTAAVPELTNLYYTDARSDARITLQKAQPNGLASLDGSGLIPPSQIPPLAIDQTYVVASQAAMLALSANVGDIAVRSDINSTFILQTAGASTLAHWVMILNPGAVISVNGFTGAVSLTTSDIPEGSNLYFTTARVLASVSATSPIVDTAGVFSCAAATGSVDGCLSSIDWTTFNGKEPAITASTTAKYWRGDKTFQTLDTSVVPENTNLYFTNGRAQAAVSATAPIVDTAGVFSCTTATGSVTGCVSSTDWTTFNNKQATISAGTGINFSSNTVSLANPSASTIGGIESLASVAHKWLNAISTAGVPSATQPDTSDLTTALSGIVKGNGSTLTTADASDFPQLTPINTTAKTANYTLTNTDYSIEVDPTGGAFVVTMPASPTKGKEFVITNISTGTNVVTLNPNSAETFGVTALAHLHLSTVGESWKIKYDGSNYAISYHNCNTAVATYTPVITGTIGNPTVGTTTANTMYWYRAGNMMRFNYAFKQTAAGTTGSGGTFMWSFPSGYTADSSAAASTTVGLNNWGNGWVFQSSQSGESVSVQVRTTSTFALESAGGNTFITSGFINFGAAAAIFEIKFTGDVPIANWEP